MFRSLGSCALFGIRLSLTATGLFLFSLTATSPVANAQTTIPCASDSQGNPIYFNTSTNDGSTPMPYLCTITTTVNPDGSEDVRIDQPNVDVDFYDYNSIVFSPSDLVTVTADGCVQTAGEGSTWKKYVNPSGDNSGPPDGLYYGAIKIKGAMTINGFIPDSFPNNALYYLTSPIVNPPLQIFIQPVQTYPGAGNVHLVLGYKDDNYNDEQGNGYWGHDNGNNDQCINTDPTLPAQEIAGTTPYGQYGGPAFVNLHIVHNASNPFGNTPPKDWDLVQNGLDVNGIAANPNWGWQVNGGFITNQGLYDPTCFPGCTSQVTSYDLPMFSGFDAVTHWLAGICKPSGPIGGQFQGIKGHHNWFDATYNGTIYWVTHAGPTFGDDDYNMRLVTPTLGHADPAGTSFFNGASFEEGNLFAVLLEFDSDETIDHFDQSLFWNVFHQTVDNQGDTAAGNIINGHDAVAIGLMGADEEHDGHVEIHPVHALAIRESAPGSPVPSNDLWAFFVRNWGDEGECSSQQHFILDSQITIQLTPPVSLLTPKATLNGDSLVFGSGTNTPYTFYSGPEGTFVTFNLPAGNQQGFVFGEIDLSWTNGTGMAQPAAQATNSLPAADLPAPLNPAATTVDAPGDAETLLASAFSNMTRAQQQTYLSLLHLLSPPPPPIMSNQLLPQILTSPPQRPANVPGVGTAVATTKLLRDAAQGQAVCAATAGNLPTQPTWCPNTTFPPVTTLTTTGGTPVVIGWYTTPVTATLTTYDASGSGIAFTQFGYDGLTWTNYTGPLILPDGVYTFYYRSQDNQGNLETTRQQAFKIDTRPPVITITQPVSGNYTHSSTLTLNYTVTDGPTSGLGAGSGVASFTPTMDGATTVGGLGLASGQTINLLTEMTLGSHTFTVNAVDNVGHASSQSITFTIIVTPDSIIGDVNQFFAAGKITQDEATSLLSKLQAAKSAYLAGACTTAANIYQSFINELRAQSGKLVDATAAAIMIADAQYLIAHCP